MSGHVWKLWGTDRRFFCFTKLTGKACVLLMHQTRGLGRRGPTRLRDMCWSVAGPQAVIILPQH
jgi:hypothetical protein